MDNPCNKCKWCEIRDWSGCSDHAFGLEFTCKHPNTFGQVDPVTGEKIWKVTHCNDCRADDKRCGHEGKCFEPMSFTDKVKRTMMLFNLI